MNKKVDLIKKVSSALSVFAVAVGFLISSIGCLAAEVPSQGEYRRRMGLQKEYWDINQLVPDNHILTFDPKTGMEKKEDLRLAAIMVFRIAGEQDFVIKGDRFTKDPNVRVDTITLGGKRELGRDKTPMDVIFRKKIEGWYGQLVFRQFTVPREIYTAGGFQVDPKTNKILSKGWGPHRTWVVVEKGYTLDDLNAAVEALNINAALHDPVANFFRDLPTFQLEDIPSKAQGLLSSFEAAIDTYGLRTKEAKSGIIVNLLAETRAMLESLIENPRHQPSEKENGFQFAVRCVHDYTKYNKFHLMAFEDYMRSNHPKESPEADKMAFRLTNPEKFKEIFPDA